MIRNGVSKERSSWWQKLLIQHYVGSFLIGVNIIGPESTVPSHEQNTIILTLTIMAKCKFQEIILFSKIIVIILGIFLVNHYFLKITEILIIDQHHFDSITDHHIFNLRNHDNFNI